MELQGTLYDDSDGSVPHSFHQPKQLITRVIHASAKNIPSGNKIAIKSEGVCLKRPNYGNKSHLRFFEYFVRDKGNIQTPL